MTIKRYEELKAIIEAMAKDSDNFESGHAVYHIDYDLYVDSGEYEALFTSPREQNEFFIIYNRECAGNPFDWADYRDLENTKDERLDYMLEHDFDIDNATLYYTEIE